MNITDWDRFYLQAGELVRELPELTGGDSMSAEDYRWLGRLSTLIEATSSADSIAFKVANNNLASSNSHTRRTAIHEIKSILYRTHAYLESMASTAVQGAVIPVGAAFDALQSVGKVLAMASRDLLIVDPYMDAQMLTEFARLAHERVQLRLLSVARAINDDGMRAAAERWRAQFGDSRPLEMRSVPKHLLHDRLIVVDEKEIYNVSQSFKNLADRSPASITRVVGMVEVKLETYAQMWADATSN